MAVLPELKNGDTTPESGMAPSTPPEIKSISNAISAPSPKAKNIPYSVGALRAARNDRCTRKPSKRKTAATPAKPHSSPIAGNTRSVLPAGIIDGSPHPGPDPHTPPVDNAHSECAN